MQKKTNSKELPASQGMLQLVRRELKADIGGLRSEMKAGFDQMDSRFHEMDSKLSQTDSKFSLVDSRFNQMDSKFEQVLSEVARVGFLVEEQNSKNQVVLEGLVGLYHRQDRRNEARTEEVYSLVLDLAARVRR